jgi:hypothetical protein
MLMALTVVPPFPLIYSQWRYAIGEDREALQKVDRQITEEEKKKMAQQFVIEGTKRVVERILGRRKVGCLLQCSCRQQGRCHSVCVSVVQLSL